MSIPRKIEADFPTAAPPSGRLVGHSARQRCLCCGAEYFVTLETSNQVVMRQCQSCGLWVNASAPDGLADTSHYTAPYHQYHYGRRETHRRRTAGCLIRQIEALQPRGRLLDVGCSSGHVVAAAAARGWDAYGVDVAPDIVEACAKRGLQVQVGSLHALPFTDEFFGVVHARHVLEHDLEVFRSLAEMRRVLAPDGLLVVVVPDAGCPKVRRRRGKYAKFWKPDHLLGFTRGSLCRIMAEAGFVPAPVSTFAGVRAGSLTGLPYFLGRRLMELAVDALGIGNTLRTYWRQADRADR